MPIALFAADDPARLNAPAALLRRLLLWALICCVSAAPSFVWAENGFDRWAMAFGVALFILGYTAFTSTAGFYRFKSRPFVRRTLYIGYGLRLGLSIGFPVGMAVDLMPGMISLNVVGSLGLDTHSFVGTFATTVVQGAILNCLLSIFMAVVYAIQKALMKPPPVAQPHGFDVIMPATPAVPVQAAHSAAIR